MPFDRSQLDPGSRQPLYVQLSEVLAGYIATPEGMRAGRLPGELELCGHFGVSRNTVARAVKILGDANLVRRVKHRGTLIVAAQSNRDPARGRASIGLVFPISVSWNAALRTIEEEVNLHGYNLEIFPYQWESPEAERDAVERARARCSGLILYPDSRGAAAPLVDKLNREKFPLVLFDIDFSEVACNAVVTDGESAGFQLGRYLIERGCRRIACYSWLGRLNSSRRKIAGFTAALTQAGLEAGEMLEIDGGAVDSPEVLRRLRESLARRPDGIFCTFMWKALFDELQHTGTDSISIANFDIAPFLNLNFEVLSAETPKLAIASRAVRLLCERIRHPDALFEKCFIAHRIIRQPKGGHLAP